MKHILFSILFICASFLSFSQSRDTISLFKSEKKKNAMNEIQLADQTKTDSVILSIKYGRNNGRCIGYCFQEATIDSTTMLTFKKSFRTDPNYPTKTDTAQITSDQWNMLISSTDVNSFFSLPEKIGTPGAADGGIEWIEINYAGKTHKVTYDKAHIDDYDGLRNMDKILQNIAHF